MLLYIHIPFCDSKCSYCSFHSYVDKFHLQKRYFQALYTQLEAALCSKRIDTVFIGGGTPSSVDAKLYTPLFSLLDTPRIKEITVEANPGSADAAWMEAMKGFGVDRISLGVQSFDKDKLKYLNRSHSPQKAKEAIKTAQGIFKRVSIDLIYNTPLDTVQLLQEDLQIFASFATDHISAYELTIEKGTALEGITLPEDRFSHMIADILEAKGYKQYEISNFGNPSLHNLGYWQYEPYLGIGAGAIGFDGRRRVYNTADIESYIADPFGGQIEELSKKDREIERLFLGLRSKVGFVPADEKTTRRARFLEQKGKLIKKSSRYYNPNFCLADELALYLLK
ncbi:MAG: radical SAM family heme chaperone HemW [Campylobacterota bacterium]